MKVGGIPAGELFGGGGAVAAQLSGDGRWVIVVDDRCYCTSNIQRGGGGHGGEGRGVDKENIRMREPWVK